ncbi:thioredoxin family protein [bacterium]|nr:thioredoxin family protein [bacterium]
MGADCPDFDLINVDGSRVKRDDFKGKKVLLVVFTCNHCPYAVAVEDLIAQLGREYGYNRNFAMVAIQPNDPNIVAADSLDNMQMRAEEKDFRFPYLWDETQDAARAFDAVCTPEFYLFDADRKLVYHGRLDDNWQDPSKVTRRELKEAIDLLLEGKQPPTQQYPSMGCSIKWREQT